MAHRMEESIQISDVVINASGNCVWMWGEGFDIYTSTKSFPLMDPRTLPNMDLYHGGQKANTELLPALHY